MDERRSTLFACLFLLIAVTAFFLPAMTGVRGLFHDDQAMEEFPRYYFLSRSLQQGILPLWDPQTWCGGIPFYARYYADTYYLPLWPFYFLTDTARLDRAYWTLILLPLWLHYALAAWGMYAFLRKLFSCGCAAACLGSLAYVFSPAFGYAYVWQQAVSVQAWLPWFLCAYASAVEKTTLRKVCCAGLFFSFILTAGIPSLWPLVGVAWVATAIALAVARRREKREKPYVLPAAVMLFVGLVGVLLSSIYLCSFLEGRYFTSEHITLTAEAALGDPYGSLPPLYLATLFVPDLFGNVTGTLFPSLSPVGTVFYWEANQSGGAAFSFLVALGFVFAFGKRTTQESWRMKYAMMAAAFLYICAVLWCLGRYTPFYALTIGQVPGAGALPRPIRYRLLQCFAAALLAAGGFECLAAGGSCAPRLKRITWLYCLFSSAVLLTALWWPARKDMFVYPWLRARGSEAFREPAGRLIETLCGQGIASRHLGIGYGYWLFVAVALCVAACRTSLPRCFGRLVALGALLELLFFGSRAFYGSTYSFDRPSLNHLRFALPSQSPFVRDAAALEAAIKDPALRVFNTETFRDNFARLGRTAAFMGYEMHPLETRFKRALEAASGERVDYPLYYRRPSPLIARRMFLDNFSVGYITTKEKTPLFEGDTDIVPVGEIFVHQNHAALPRAFTMERVVAAGEDEQLRALVSGDLRQAVFLDPGSASSVARAGPGTDPARSFEDLQRLNPVSMIELNDPNRVLVHIKVTVPAMLVVTEVWYPGWEAFVDGRRTELYRVNYCQRGVWLTQGTHKVELCFAPRAWRAGLWVLAVTAAVCAGVFLLTKNVFHVE